MKELEIMSKDDVKALEKEAKVIEEKITELNPAQLKLIEVVRDEWLNRFFVDNLHGNLKMDQDKVTEAVGWVYDLAGYEAPEVRFTKSPLDALRIANEAMGTTQTYYQFSLYFNAWDFQWVAFYDFFERIGVVKNGNFKKYREFSKLGVYDTIQFDKMCIVVEMPEEIHTDGENRLHCESGPAIKWSDCNPKEDFGYYWHGVNTKDDLINDPSSITKDVFMKEENIEQKRIIKEILGTEQFGAILDLEELDRDTDGQGNIQILLKTIDKDPLIEINEGDGEDGHIYFVKVICPSSDREYHICVPPSKNVWEAVAWTFDREGDSYRPTIET